MTMKKNVLRIMTLLLTVSMLTACGSKKATDDSSALTENIANLEKKITELETENTTLKADLETLTQERDELLVKLGELAVETPVETPTEPAEPAADEEVILVYGADSNSKPYQESSVTVKTDEPLLNKMVALSKELGETYFEGLTMEALEIKTVNGKDVLVVNLIEGSGKVGEKSWVYNYFQGSTGGNNTTIALSETFLQKNYNGTWIDGVQFLLDGETIDYEHVPSLKEIIYR